jgi:hypothetical protein
MTASRTNATTAILEPVIPPAMIATTMFKNSEPPCLAFHSLCAQRYSAPVLNLSGRGAAMTLPMLLLAGPFLGDPSGARRRAYAEVTGRR